MATNYLLLLNIGNTYRDGMDLKDIYKVARRAWKKPSINTDYVLTVAKGVVVGVYKIDTWRSFSKDSRLWCFNGEIAPPEFCKKYIGQKIRMYGSMGYKLLG